MKLLLPLLLLLTPVFLAGEDNAAIQASFQAQLKKLSDDNFDARVAAAKAARELLDAHDDALLPLLKATLAAEKNPDVRTRLEAILESAKSAGQIEWISDEPFRISTAIASAGRVVACDGRKIACFNADNGRQIWSADSGGLLHEYGAIDGGKVFFIRIHKKNEQGAGYTPECAVLALDLATGKKLWSWGEGSGGVKCSHPIVSNGTLFFCREIATGENFELVAIDTATGQKRWSNESGKAVNTPAQPAAADGKVIYHSSTRGLLCLDEKTGNAIWSTGLKPTASEGAVIDKGKVYVAADGAQNCLDLQTGMMQWSVSLKILSCPPAVAAGRLYRRTGTGMACLNADNGTILWTKDFEQAHGPMSQPIVVKDRLYFSFGAKSDCYCLDANNGNELWKSKDPNTNLVRHLAAAGGRVFFPHRIPNTNKDHIAALKTNREGPAEWPMPGGNARRSGCNDAAPEPKP